jgi:hypothetical protein
MSHNIDISNGRTSIAFLGSREDSSSLRMAVDRHRARLPATTSFSPSAILTYAPYLPVERKPSEGR